MFQLKMQEKIFYLLLKNSMDYIATFFTHSGAIKFNRFLLKNNISNETLPVPRQLSSIVELELVFSYDGQCRKIFY